MNPSSFFALVVVAVFVEVTVGDKMKMLWKKPRPASYYEKLSKLAIGSPAHISAVEQQEFERAKKYNPRLTKHQHKLDYNVRQNDNFHRLNSLNTFKIYRPSRNQRNSQRNSHRNSQFFNNWGFQVKSYPGRTVYRKPYIVGGSVNDPLDASKRRQAGSQTERLTPEKRKPSVSIDPPKPQEVKPSKNDLLLKPLEVIPKPLEVKPSKVDVVPSRPELQSEDEIQKPPPKLAQVPPASPSSNKKTSVPVPLLPSPKQSPNHNRVPKQPDDINEKTHVPKHAKGVVTFIDNSVPATKQIWPKPFVAADEAVKILESVMPSIGKIDLPPFIIPTNRRPNTNAHRKNFYTIHTRAQKARNISFVEVPKSKVFNATTSSKMKITQGRYLHVGSRCDAHSISTYNRTSTICCAGILKPRLDVKGGMTSCCGTTTYDPSRRICCGGKMRIKRSRKQMCCGDKAYDPDSFVCCAGHLTYGGKSGRHRRRTHVCCGRWTYNPKNQICCRGRISNRGKGIRSCCRTTPYNPYTQSCCNDGIRPKYQGCVSYGRRLLY